MMRRVAEGTQDIADDLSKRGGAKYVPVKISSLVSDDELSNTTQERLRMVRTDLDTFDRDLAALLVDHGFRTGSAALTAAGFAAANPLPGLLARQNPGTLDRIARNAAKRSFRSLFFDFRDWKALPLLWVLAAALLGGLVFVGFNAWTAREARRQEEQAKSDLALNQARDSNEKRKYAEQLVKDLTDKNSQLSRQIAELKGVPAPEQPRVAAVANVDPTRYKVWIQFAGSLTREEMSDFGRRIRQKWPNAPGADRGGERTPNAAGQLEVRCNPVDATAAAELTEDVKSSGLFNRMNPPRQTSIIPPGSLEIWLSR